jgi:ubiquinone biosynthesis protein
MGPAIADDTEAATGLRIEPIVLPTPSRQAVAARFTSALLSVGRHLGPLARRSRRTSASAANGHATAHALRLVFDDLAATFTKFGQLIGSSPGLFGDEVAGEFRACLDAGPPVPFAQVRAALESELGRPLDEVFASFEPTPLAAASIAVVHRAQLLDGRSVAVKVLRPGIESVVATDIAVMRPLFMVLARQVALGLTPALPGLVDGLAIQIAEELDLTNEVRSLHHFRAVVDRLDLPLLHLPEPIDELSSRRVLTMEFLDAIAIDDVAGAEAMGIDPRPLLQQAIQLWFATSLCDGVFHGDIHAGNLLVTREGRLGLVDWGIVGRLDDETHRFFRRMIEGCLGDESAWPDVRAAFLKAYGPGLQHDLGMSDEQMVAFIRTTILALMTSPLAEVDLRMLMGPPTGRDASAPAASGPADKFRYWRGERRRVRRMLDSAGAGSDFDRGTFLLSKQLLYLERYGKLYLPDTPLVWDTDAFRRMLASSPS